MSIYYTFPEADRCSIHAKFEPFPEASYVEPHKHHFYEFAYIQRGSCTHTYKGTSFPLIPGDLVLISPDEEHSYQINPYTNIINCYFFPERIYQLSDFIVDGSFRALKAPKTLEDFQADWEHLMDTISLRDITTQLKPYKATEMMAKQGVLHLPAKTASNVEMMLFSLLDECTNPKFNSEQLKSAYLQILLAQFGRTGSQLVEKQLPLSVQKKYQILNALTLIDEHYMDDLTVQDMAQATSFSEASFRRIFKDITGLSPSDYLNRIRIMNALKYIQFKGMPIAEAAAKVGIYDANYFSRLFKKLIGHSPRYFRKISDMSPE